MDARSQVSKEQGLEPTQRILYGAMAATGGFYRKQAERLLGLATSSPLEEAKAEFLELAQRYEALADHAALKACDVWPERRRRMRKAGGASAPPAAGSRGRT
jgi:hypothetical protein